MLKIGITGHRMLNNPIIDLKETIEHLLKEHNVKTFEAYTSLAIGADLIFAQLATDEYKAELHVILPYCKVDYIKTIPVDYQSNFFEQAKDCY